MIRQTRLNNFTILISFRLGGHVRRRSTTQLNHLTNIYSFLF